MEIFELNPCITAAKGTSDICAKNWIWVSAPALFGMVRGDDKPFFFLGLHPERIGEMLMGGKKFDKRSCGSRGGVR